MCILKQISWIISEVKQKIKKEFNVLALENILVSQTREIGDGPCFLYLKFSGIDVSNLRLISYWKFII